MIQCSHSLDEKAAGKDNQAFDKISNCSNKTQKFQHILKSKITTS